MDPWLAIQILLVIIWGAVVLGGLACLLYRTIKVGPQF